MHVGTATAWPLPPSHPTPVQSTVHTIPHTIYRATFSDMHLTRLLHVVRMESWCLQWCQISDISSNDHTTPSRSPLFAVSSAYSHDSTVLCTAVHHLPNASVILLRRDLFFFPLSLSLSALPLGPPLLGNLSCAHLSDLSEIQVQYKKPLRARVCPQFSAKPNTASAEQDCHYPCLLSPAVAKIQQGKGKNTARSFLTIPPRVSAKEKAPKTVTATRSSAAIPALPNVAVLAVAQKTPRAALAPPALFLLGISSFTSLLAMHSSSCFCHVIPC